MKWTRSSSSLDDLKEVFDGAGVFEGIPDDEDPEEADIDISETLTAADAQPLLSVCSCASSSR